MKKILTRDQFYLTHFTIMLPVLLFLLSSSACFKIDYTLKDPLDSKENTMIALQKYWNNRDFKTFRRIVEPDRREVFDGMALEIHNLMREYVITGYRIEPECCEDGPDYTGFVVHMTTTGKGKLGPGQQIEKEMKLRLIEGKWMLSFLN